GDHKHVAPGIGGRRGVALPDAALVGVRGCIEDGYLRKSLGIVGHDPAMIRADVAGGGPGQIYVPVREQESRARILSSRIETHLSVCRVLTLAPHGGLDDNWTA